MENIDWGQIGAYFAAFMAAIGWLMQYIKNSKFLSIAKKIQGIYKSGRQLEEFLNDPIVKNKVIEHFDDKAEHQILDIAKDLKEFYKK